jgi:putative redox protein
MALQQFQSPNDGIVARPAGEGRFRTEIGVRGGTILADEPLEVGGDGMGPTPYELLSAALAACTVMTLRLYAERKGWELPKLSVGVAHSLQPGGADGSPPQDRFDRLITFGESIDAERQSKLLEIADRCPVHRTLMRGFVVQTSVGPASGNPPDEPAGRHQRDIEAACAED